MDEQPREDDTSRRLNWRRMIWPLSVVLVLAAVVCRRDGHLSWLATALVLVAITAATALYWRFMTRKVLPSLARRPRTWQSRSGHLKVTVRCKSCGSSADASGGQVDSCPSCGGELG